MLNVVGREVAVSDCYNRLRENCTLFGDSPFLYKKPDFKFKPPLIILCHCQFRKWKHFSQGVGLLNKGKRKPRITFYVFLNISLRGSSLSMWLSDISAGAVCCPDQRRSIDIQHIGQIIIREGAAESAIFIWLYRGKGKLKTHKPW